MPPCASCSQCTSPVSSVQLLGILEPGRSLQVPLLTPLCSRLVDTWPLSHSGLALRPLPPAPRLPHPLTGCSSFLAAEPVPQFCGHCHI